MNCDAIARWYRWLEYAGFGRELERRRFRYLKEVQGARRVLLLGDGDGRFAARLQQEHPDARVDVIEVSPGMVALAKERTRAEISYYVADARTHPFPEREYDLVVTNFFLDCFNSQDAGKLVTNIGKACRPNATWLVAEFHQPERGWRAIRARLWLTILYRFFGLTTGLETRDLVDHRPMMVGAGFHLRDRESASCGLLISEVWRSGSA